MKKYIIGIVVVLVGIVGFIVVSGNNNAEDGSGESGFSLEIGPGNRFEEEETDTSGGVQLANEIVYSGKVVPEETVYVFIDATEELDTLMISVDDEVSEGDVLFTYETSNIDVNVNDEIIKREQIEDLRTSIYTANEYIDEINEWISNEDKDDENYENTIYMYNDMIEDEQVNIASFENQIITLEEQIENLYEETAVELATVDGLVYEIDDDQLLDADPTKPFVTIISTSRVINIEVAEYELPYISEGDIVEVQITGTDKVIEGTVESIDILPNNINSTDTSYYDTVIALEGTMPYGASAMISVSLGE